MEGLNKTREEKGLEGKHLNEDVSRKERAQRGRKTLAPNDGFLIHEVINHLYAVPQLELRLFRHR